MRVTLEEGSPGQKCHHRTWILSLGMVVVVLFKTPCAEKKNNFERHAGIHARWFYCPRANRYFTSITRKGAEWPWRVKKKKILISLCLHYKLIEKILIDVLLLLFNRLKIDSRCIFIGNASQGHQSIIMIMSNWINVASLNYTRIPLQWKIGKETSVVIILLFKHRYKIANYRFGKEEIILVLRAAWDG